MYKKPVIQIIISILLAVALIIVAIKTDSPLFIECGVNTEC